MLLKLVRRQEVDHLKALLGGSIDMYCHALLSKKYMGLISVHHDIMYRWFW